MDKFLDNILNIKTFSFKNKFPLEYRIKIKNESNLKYPDKIPIICEPKSNISFLENKIFRYLVVGGTKVTDIITRLKQDVVDYLIKNNKQTPRFEFESIMCFSENNTILRNDWTINSIYIKHKDPEDDMLYIMFSIQETYGH